MRTVLESLQEIQRRKDIGVQFADFRGRLTHHSYSELVEHGRRFAGALLRREVDRGTPVILVMTEPENAVIAILGCMIAGCPPAPVYPPMNLRAVPSFLQFIKHVAQRSGAAFVVADVQPYAFLGNVPHESPSIRGVEKFSAMMQSTTAEEIRTEHRDVAFLQFTSGSTSAPKGVVIPHEALAANLRMIREATHMDETSCVVTWLPVYHDMGLIGTVLNAITLPCKLVVLPPILFLKKPRLWLELIGQFRGTHTAAPNFAYGLCARRIADVSGLDLASMTTFICGAEPVLPRTMETFVNHFASAGLRAESMTPAYGLAEATLAVTFTPFLRGMATEDVDISKLAESRLAVRSDTGNNIRIASCGFPLNGLFVRVVSENGGDSLPERAVGEIQIRGESISPGYVGDSEATNVSRTPDGWMRTGDLGYVAGGELYPCGRIKDIIIIRGKNYHAHDLESIASEVQGIRTGNVVAFSVSQESGERLIVVAESREDTSPELARLVRNHIVDSMGVSTDEVVIVPAGTLPKTSSGKLKRLDTRRLFEEGKLLTSRPGKLHAMTTALKSGLGFLRRK